MPVAKMYIYYSTWSIAYIGNDILITSDVDAWFVVAVHKLTFTIATPACGIYNTFLHMTLTLCR